MPELDWRKAIIASQVWWIRASRRKRALALAAAFLVFLALTQLFGCGRSVSEDNQSRVSQSGPSARQIQKAQDQLNSEERIRSVQRDLSLEVFYNQGLLAISSADGDTVVLKDGNRLRFTGRCWEPAGQTSRPRRLQMVLPLEEPSALFNDREVIDGKTYIAYTSERLGSWGPGSGSLILDESDRPVGYTYSLNGSSDEYSFKITYPDKLPELNLKRC